MLSPIAFGVSRTVTGRSIHGAGTVPVPPRTGPGTLARTWPCVGISPALGYRRIVQLLVSLVIVPGVLLSAIGVLLLVLDKGSYNLLIGILVLTFTGTLVTGVILVWVFLRRERDLSELQADFVSKVSHELRTPLTSIRMFTETLALRRGDAAAEDRCIDALNKESSRLQGLIDRLLDWGRMESGRRVYELAEHDVAAHRRGGDRGLRADARAPRRGARRRRRAGPAARALRPDARWSTRS